MEPEVVCLHVFLCLPYLWHLFRLQEQGCCEWKEVTSDPASQMEVKPCARSGHSLVVVGRKAIVFGGCADSDQAPGAFYWRVSGPILLQHMNNSMNKVLIAAAYLFHLCFPHSFAE